MWRMPSCKVLVLCRVLVVSMVMACHPRPPARPTEVPTVTEVERPPEPVSIPTRQGNFRVPDSTSDAAPAVHSERCDPLDARSPELASVEGPNWLIEFPKDRDDGLSKEALAEIDRIAAVLLGVPGACLEITGHVAHMPGAGDDSYGKDLSRRRADRVRALLIERGVHGWRLLPLGWGYDAPLETNATAQGRRRNERIEFMVIDSPNDGEGRAP